MHSRLLAAKAAADSDIFRIQAKNAAAVEARRHPVSFTAKQHKNKLVEHQLKLRRDTHHYM